MRQRASISHVINIINHKGFFVEEGNRGLGKAKAGYVRWVGGWSELATWMSYHLMETRRGDIEDAPGRGTSQARGRVERERSVDWGS